MGLLFNSQTLRPHINDLGVSRAAVGPGTKNSAIKAMIMTGAISETTTRIAVVICSLTYGKEISRSVSENGRRCGVTKLRPPPIAAMAL